MTDKKLTIIGALPQPYGGVSGFLRRLFLDQDKNIDCFLDIYPEQKDALPPELEEKTVFLRGKLNLLSWYYLHLFNKRDYFFNFSQLKSLYFFMLFPKMPWQRWRILFHHGNLASTNFLFTLIYKHLAKKFDTIYALSPKQRTVLQGIGFKNIVTTKSYCAVKLDEEAELPEAFTKIKEQYGRIYMMSGYPTDIYNYDVAITYFKKHMSLGDALVIFIYGPGDQRQSLCKRAESLDSLFIFEDKNEAYFTKCLASSDFYLRLNSVDSFGIAVADAISLGVKTIATDVCERFPGAVIIQNLDDQTLADAFKRAEGNSAFDITKVSKDYYFRL